MPPISCTSKWRIPSTRLPASRTVAKASGSRSSTALALRRARSRNSSVLARNCSSLKALECGFLKAVDALHRLIHTPSSRSIAAAKNLTEQIADHYGPKCPLALKTAKFTVSTPWEQGGNAVRMTVLPFNVGAGLRPARFRHCLKRMQDGSQSRSCVGFCVKVLFFPGQRCQVLSRIHRHTTLQHFEMHVGSG